MKLIYLKKFNEAYEDELSFETFKEILFDLSDSYECQMYDYSEDESDPYYDCHLTLPKSINVQFRQEDNLTEYLPPFDGPEEVDSDTLRELRKHIDEENGQLKDLEGKINLLIERNRKIKEIISTLETEIIPRLQSFSNCQSVTLGYDCQNRRRTYFSNTIIRICFDMPSED